MIKLIATGSPVMFKVAFESNGVRGPIEGYVAQQRGSWMWRGFYNNGRMASKKSFVDPQSAAKVCVHHYKERSLIECDRLILVHVAKVAAATTADEKYLAEGALNAVMAVRNAIKPLG